MATKKSDAPKLRITFPRTKKPSGLAGVACGTRGWDIKVNGVEIGRIMRHGEEKFVSIEGKSWYWYARIGDLVNNRWQDPPKFFEQCKKEAREFIHGYYSKRPPQP